MSEKMGNAPVYFTVAQVRFNPILNIEGYLSAIQDRMRIAGFPDYKRVELKQIALPFSSAGEDGQPPAPIFVPQVHCIFGNMEGTTDFVFQSNSLALQTTEYDVFDTFLEIFMKGLEIIDDVLKLHFVERIGLRYLDAVLPKKSETLSDYLTVEVIGISQKLNGEMIHSFSETVSSNKNGQLISRVIIQRGRVGLPPEISMLAPRINKRFTDAEGIHAIIDTDAFSELREKFNMESINSKLVALHNEINKSFDATVRPHALSVWK